MKPPRAELEALVAEYREALPQKLARLDALLAAGKLRDLERELHTLAGSAGTFGLPKVGEAARAAEAHLAAGGGRAGLERLLRILRHEAEVS